MNTSYRKRDIYDIVGKVSVDGKRMDWMDDFIHQGKRYQEIDDRLAEVRRLMILEIWNVAT